MVVVVVVLFFVYSKRFALSFHSHRTSICLCMNAFCMDWNVRFSMKPTTLTLLFNFFLHLLLFTLCSSFPLSVASHFFEKYSRYAVFIVQKLSINKIFEYFKLNTRSLKRNLSELSASISNQIDLINFWLKIFAEFST